MLDDRQLENLVRMAAEIEAMDALASGKPQLRLTNDVAPRAAARTERRSLFAWRKSAAFGTLAAAAAALAFVFAPGGLMTASNTPGSGSNALPTPPQGGGIAMAPEGGSDPYLWPGNGGVWPAVLPWPFNGEPVDPTITAVRSGDIRGALLAILEDDAGRVECVKWVEHDWDGRSLADVKASDLVALSLMMTCDRMTARQMTVVGMRGPADELPLGDARAQELASCIMHAPAKCSTMTCCNPGAAVECIPDDVSVRFERVSFR